MTAPATRIEGGASQLDLGQAGAKLEGESVKLADAGQGTAQLSGGQYVVNAPQGITFRCGEQEIALTPDGIVIRGTKLEINGHRVEVGSATEVRLQSEVFRVDAAQAEINAARLDISGDEGPT